MSNIGLIVTINRFTQFFESQFFAFTLNTLEDAYNKFISLLVDKFKNINIDFPDNLLDFEYEWFKRQYVKCNAFSYKIFMDNKWSEPWDCDDIYNDMLIKMEEYEIQTVPDFTQMYCEPDLETEDNFDCQTEIFESKIKEIISHAEEIKDEDSYVKDCSCDKCKEGFEIQQIKKQQEEEYNKNIFMDNI